MLYNPVALHVNSYTMGQHRPISGALVCFSAHVDQTTVYISATDYGTTGVSVENHLDAGQFFDITINSSESYHIVGNNALLLAELSKGE